MSHLPNWLIALQLNVLKKHLEQYDQNFVSKGKHPRDKDWRPVRFAVRDVILAWVVARLQEKDTIFIPSYPPGSIVYLHLADFCK